jgi:hypothetical protein
MLARTSAVIFALLVAAASVAACTNKGIDFESLLPHPCEPESCPTTDLAPDSKDFVIKLAPGQLISLEVQQVTSFQSVTGGEVVLSKDLADPPCYGESGVAGCKVTLKRLRLELESTQVNSSVGTFSLDDVVVSLVAPVTLETTGTGALLPSGSTVQTCMSLQGVSEDLEEKTTEKDYGVLSFSIAEQFLTLSLVSLPLAMGIGSQCEVIPMSLSGDLSGVTPWAQRPIP